MRSLRKWLLPAGLVVLVAGCADAGDDLGSAARSDPDTAAPAMAGADAGDHAAGDEHHAGASHGSLPLRPIMQQLSADMAGLSQAIWFEDYDAMIASAAAVAEHPHISGEETARIEAELGSELATFEEMDHAVHEASERLYQAAEAREIGEVLDLFSEVQRGCVACHTEFRERLRTDM